MFLPNKGFFSNQFIFFLKLTIFPTRITAGVVMFLFDFTFLFCGAEVVFLPKTFSRLPFGSSCGFAGRRAGLLPRNF